MKINNKRMFLVELVFTVVTVVNHVLAHKHIITDAVYAAIGAVALIYLWVSLSLVQKRGK